MKSAKPPVQKPIDSQQADRVVAEARRSQAQRETSYPEQALKLNPWVCGRCARAFLPATVRMLTVHHKDHDHDNNPPDGSNWELLCLYCHDNEHSRRLEHAAGGGGGAAAGSGDGVSPSGHKAFAGLESLLKGRNTGKQ